MLRKIKNAYIKLKNKYECWQRRRHLKDKDFSIISNNCWGGFIYQMFGLEYTTPTIGLFIYEKDYVKFCSDLKYYLSQDLEFINVAESKYYDKVTEQQTKEITYPIARLDDVEVFFMHYHSQEEAVEKWNRRKQRINYEKLLVKMSQRNDCDEQTIENFCALPYLNKICFTEDDCDADCCVTVEKLKELNQIGGDETQLTLEKIDIYKVLNSF